MVTRLGALDRAGDSRRQHCLRLALKQFERVLSTAPAGQMCLVEHAAVTHGGGERGCELARYRWIGVDPAKRQRARRQARDIRQGVRQLANVDLDWRRCTHGGLGMCLRHGRGEAQDDSAARFRNLCGDMDGCAVDVHRRAAIGQLLQHRCLYRAAGEARGQQGCLRITSAAVGHGSGHRQCGQGIDRQVGSHDHAPQCQVGRRVERDRGGEHAAIRSPRGRCRPADAGCARRPAIVPVAPAMAR